MRKLKVSTREIGTVSVFDLEGMPTEQALNEIALKIQRGIRRHRMQRVILNFQNMADVDVVGLRKILAACLRPKSSLIYGASQNTLNVFNDIHVPNNIRICPDEESVAERFGPFLLEKDSSKQFSVIKHDPLIESIGHSMDRRRSKRMHVAMPVELGIETSQGIVLTRALITNISEGGIFSEFLSLDEANKVTALGDIVDCKVQIKIPPCANFPEEYNVTGTVVRKTLQKKQLGLGIKFNVEMP